MTKFCDYIAAAETPAQFLPSDLIPFIVGGATCKIPFSLLLASAIPYVISDLSSIIGDYALQVGETVFIPYTTAASVPLKIATVPGLYEVKIIGASVTGAGGSVDGKFLPNNVNTNNNEVTHILSYTGSSASSGNTVASHANFLLGSGNIIYGNMLVSTLTNNKNVMSESMSINSNSHYLYKYYSYWHDSVLWTSLGTIVFDTAVSQSGRVIVKRII